MIGTEPPREGPEAFAAVVAAVRAAPTRAEVELEDVPGPGRLAPHALAISGEVATGRDEDLDIASGRFVLLHDPHGQEGWNGSWRVVVLVRAHLEAELAAEPMLLPVAWAWVQESLALHDVEPTALGGTTTRVASQGFGDLAVHPGTVEVQVRASLSPTAESAARAFSAWTDLLCTVAGLPPLPPGVLRFPSHG